MASFLHEKKENIIIYEIIPYLSYKLQNIVCKIALDRPYPNILDYSYEDAQYYMRQCALTKIGFFSPFYTDEEILSDSIPAFARIFSIIYLLGKEGYGSFVKNRKKYYIYASTYVFLTDAFGLYQYYGLDKNYHELYCILAGSKNIENFIKLRTEYVHGDLNFKNIIFMNIAIRQVLRYERRKLFDEFIVGINPVFKQEKEYFSNTKRIASVEDGIGPFLLFYDQFKELKSEQEKGRFFSYFDLFYNFFEIFSFSLTFSELGSIFTFLLSCNLERADKVHFLKILLQNRELYDIEDFDVKLSETQKLKKMDPEMSIFYPLNLNKIAFEEYLQILLEIYNSEELPGSKKPSRKILDSLIIHWKKIDQLSFRETNLFHTDFIRLYQPTNEKFYDEINPSYNYWLKNVPYIIPSVNLENQPFRAYSQLTPSLDLISQDNNNILFQVKKFLTPNDNKFIPYSLFNIIPGANYFFSKDLFSLNLMDFSAGQTNKVESIQMNGRNFYLGIVYNPAIYLSLFKERLEIAMPLKTTDFVKMDIISFFSQNEGKIFSVPDLICKYISNPSLKTNDFIRSLICQTGADCLTHCTQFGNKLSKSLIKIAATRIFADPARAILELLVNSLDAYRNKSVPLRATSIDIEPAALSNRQAASSIPIEPAALSVPLRATSIGKFGMGFYSFLYFLIGHPKRHLDIYSYNKGYSYRIRLQEMGSEGILTFRMKNLSIYTETTGTMMILDHSEDRMEKSFPNLKDISYELSRIKHINTETGALFYFLETDFNKLSAINEEPSWIHEFELQQEDLFSSEMNSNEKKEKIISLLTEAVSKHGFGPNQVIVKNIPGALIIEDYATGISFDVLFRSLLIPSISTKLGFGSSEQIINKSHWIGHSHIVPNTNLEERLGSFYSNLHITVSDIVVVDIKIEGKPFPYPFEIVINMPPWMKLPVSRDDIILETEADEKIFSIELTKVIRDPKNYLLVNFIQEFFNTYISYTSSEKNKRVVRDVLENFFILFKHRLVPFEFVEIFEKIPFRSGENWIFIPSNRISISDLEEHLTEVTFYRTNIYRGKKVIFISSGSEFSIPPILSCGLINFIFININFVLGFLGDFLIEINDNNMGPEELLFEGSLETELLRKILLAPEKYPNQMKWRDNLAASYQETTLYPYQTVYGEENFVKYDKLFKRFSLFKSFDKITPDVLQSYYAFMLKVESLSIYFLSVDLSEFAKKWIDIYSFLLNPTDNLNLDEKKKCKEYFFEIIEAYIEAFSKFKGNQTYGGNKYQLYITTDEFTTKKKFEQTLLYKKYFKDAIITSTKRIEEKTYFTTLYFDNCFNINSRNLNINDGDDKREKILDTLIMKLMLRQVPSSIFYIALASMMFSEKIILSLIQLDEIVLDSFLDYNLNYIVSLKPSQKNFEDLYLAYNPPYPPRMETFFVKKIKSMMISWIDSMSGTEIQKLSLGEIKFSQNDFYSFRLNTLLNYIYKKEITEMKNIKEAHSLLKKIEKIEKIGTDSINPLNIIRIAIEEGTTKGFVESICTELIQNSVDAIRSANAKIDKSIYINLQKINAEKYNEFAFFPSDTTTSFLTFTIIDYVGFNFNNWLYLSIPFLSSKKASEYVTGEMGSGFFNVYRESSLVLVNSKKDGKEIMAHDYPIQNSKGERIDVMKFVQINNISNYNRGTTIICFIPYKSDKEKIDLIGRFNFFLNQVMCHVDMNIYYNNRLINIPRTLYFSSGPFEVSLVREGIDSGSERIKESYLLTKGIPFTSLNSYFETYFNSDVSNYVSSNIVINIKHGGYTPVQTRTRINMSPENLVHFQKVLCFAVFLKIIESISKGRDTWVFPNIDSTQNVSQLKFQQYIAKEEDFKTQGLSFLFLYLSLIEAGTGFMNIGIIINLFIDEMGSAPFKPELVDFIGIFWKRYLDKMYIPITSGENFFDLLKIIIKKWLEPKNAKLIEPEKKQGVIPLNESEFELEVRLDEILDVFISTWIKTYWELGQVLGIFPKETILTIKVVIDKNLTKKGILGLYDHKIKTITINTSKLTIQDRNQIIIIGRDFLISGDFLTMLAEFRKNESIQQIFGNDVPAGAIPHEIEHARVGEDHGTSAHGQRQGKIFPGEVDEGAIRDFNQVVNETYKFLIQNRFFEKLKGELGKVLIV